ncbi:carotenoid oxygenase family protein [soil metagenome]
MTVTRFASTLPEDDSHPYRTGAWRPQTTEHDVSGLKVIGELPDDLNGVYLRNTENPLHDALGRYHPFDGDAMVHALHLHDGRADYRNRFVRTDGFEEELRCGHGLWAGVTDNPAKSVGTQGAARARAGSKDASSTDITVHNGKALTSFYLCGDLYAMDPVTLEQYGAEDWVPSDVGVCSHPKVDEATGEMLFFNYSTSYPFLHFGVVSPKGQVVHYAPVPLPGPRMPHDMAFTENYVVLNDLPMFWDPAALERGVYSNRWHPEMPSRFAIVPRRGGADDVRWFEASATNVLHWINAWEEGDEIVLDGFHQGCPNPRRDGDDGFRASARYLDANELQTRPHRWRFNLRTGETRAEFLDDGFLEFGMINSGRAGKPYRYTYAMTAEPGWFLFNGLTRFDAETAAKQEWRFDKGVFASESPFAPRAAGANGEAAEDDGYVLSYVMDMNNDTSEAQIFDASDVSAGPIARVLLPERVSSGTHTVWAPEESLSA